ncbi:helix-turn-helix domain-containing protein [uncultured Sphingomonas sp.]|uniref:ArsR/SmtB family transcription factor n=1 Tax=uncultured Sphingomonas sp. TaxID=158754 RepID=UPI0025EBCB22|nr:helix-turn-helix domain-containing protein [uncultured Sphingomonas sp.]
MAIAATYAMGGGVRGYKHPSIDDVAPEHIFQALSDPVRIDIVRRLAAVPQASCAALTGDRPKSSMSHHFRVLRDAGLVRTRIEGTAHANELRRAELDRRFPGLIDALLDAIQANGGGGAPDPVRGA